MQRELKKKVSTLRYSHAFLTARERNTDYVKTRHKLILYKFGKNKQLSKS